MLDINFIKENKDLVAENAKNKNREVKLDELLKLADREKTLRQEIDELNRLRNEASKERNVERGKELKDRAEKVTKEHAEIKKIFLSLMLQVPNIYSPDTPIGPDESANKVIRAWGEVRKFDFTPKEHDELGEALGVIDQKTAAEVAGARFVYLKGGLALMQYALLNHCISILSNKETLEEIAKNARLSLKVEPFIQVVPPVFVKPAVQNRAARFLTPEEHYMFPADDLMLVGSAEHTLAPMYMDKIVDEGDLPKRFSAFTPAFRREAGSYGKDTKGIIRQHQFDKLEMEVFSLPENSLQEQDFLVAIQEHLLRSLKIPYQVVAVSTGDMGFPDYRQIDIEAWMPGQAKYRETHTSDLTTSFQSRRLSARVKRTNGNIEPLHMNDATLCAMGRMLAVIMENYQREDGRIEIPEVLLPYMNGVTELRS